MDDTAGNSRPTKGGEDAKNPNSKRENYLDWDDYFMGLAFLAAKRSKDPMYQTGACIVDNDKKIIDIGYNGMPLGCHDDDFPWGKNPDTPEESKHSYVCHAEMNAIVNKNSGAVKGCTMYVTRFPCNECAKIIIQSRIKEVVYVDDKHKDKPDCIASRRMLKAAKVECKPFKPTNKQIVIDWTIDTPDGPQSVLKYSPIKMP